MTRTLTLPRTLKPGIGVFVRQLSRALAGSPLIDADDDEPGTPAPRERQPTQNRPDGQDEYDPKTGLPVSEAERERKKRETVKDSHDRQRDDANRGSETDSPGSQPDALGPLGDPSNNVGYSQARADAKKFQSAFGEQGLVWFAEGKSFQAAQALHDEQRRQTSKRTLAQNGIVDGMARFARGLAAQVRGIGK